MLSSKKKFMAALVVALVCSLGGNASADVGDAICRVVVTGADASVMDTPSPKGNVRFKASASAEYIAARYTTVCAGSKCDGSVWYELPGAFDWDGEKIAPSLAGRSAKGALLHASLYISAKSVREIPLREGDAEAVSEMLARKSENDYEPQETAIDKIATALVKHADKSVLEAKALRGEAAVIGVWDSDDDEEFAHVQEVYTGTFLARYFAGTPTSVYLAENGANIGGIVLGTSTMADVRKILGEMGEEHAVDEDEKDGFTFKKYNLSGGAPVYDDEAPVDRRITFKAVKKLAIEWIRGEGMGESVKIYFDEAGRAVAMEKHSIGVR